MYGNQPLSKSGCQNQANHWCCWYHLSNQVLIKSLIKPAAVFAAGFNAVVFFVMVLGSLLLAPNVMADSPSKNAKNSEPRYYTWVDAQGMMHNTLISPEKNSQEVSNKNADDNTAGANTVGENTDSVTENETSSEFNTDDFPSEEQHKKNLEKIKADQKPFFTWTDAQGIIRSELKPDVVVDFVAEEVVYDTVFAPPFRLPAYVTEGQCCESYVEAFSATAKFNGSASYQVDDTLYLFKTQAGDVAAGYFSVPDLADHEIVMLKGYKLPTGSLFEVIALNANFKPIYLASELEGIVVEETWKDLAYKKVLIEISDPDIKYFVIFARPGMEAAMAQGMEDGSGNRVTQFLSNYRLSLLREPLGD